MFRELLLVASGKRTALSRVPEGLEWEHMYAAASRQGLSGLLFRAACTLPEDQQPQGQLRERWALEIQTMEIVSDAHLGACRSLAGWFDEHGLQACILKGQAYSALYPAGAPRPSGDIDVWVHSDRSSTLSAFRKAGIPVFGVLWQECKARFFPDIELDVHFHPIRLYNPLYNSRLVSICDAEATGGFKLDDRGFRIPSKRISAVFCVAHAFLHSIGGAVSLRQFADLWLILSSLSDEEREWAFSCLRRCGLSRFTASAMFVLKEVFGIGDNILLCTPDPVRGAKLLEQIRLTGDNRQPRESGFRVVDSLDRTCGTMQFAFEYPGQVLWVPFYKIWHFCWRGVHGNL